MWDQIIKAMQRKHPVQLVKHYDDVPDSTKRKNTKWPAIAQVKEDGVYCMIVKIGDTARIFSRTGNEFYSECLQDWYDWHFCYLADGVWVSELICHDISLETLSGLVNTNRVNLWSEEDAFRMRFNAEFKVHDHLHLQEFIAGSSDRTYSARWDTVVTHVPEQKRPLTEVMESYEDWLVFKNKCINQKLEGAVIKQMHAPWVAGHKGWHVMKDVRGIHVDLMCTGVVMGTGKFEGLIAGLKFEWKGKPFTAGLGLGWDAEYQQVQTMAFLQDEFNVVNQIWHVYALQESSKGVLRLPKVAEMRIDKKEPDVL